MGSQTVRHDLAYTHNDVFIFFLILIFLMMFLNNLLNSAGKFCA